MFELYFLKEMASLFKNNTDRSPSLPCSSWGLFCIISFIQIIIIIEIIKKVATFCKMFSMDLWIFLNLFSFGIHIAIFHLYYDFHWKKKQKLELMAAFSKLFSSGNLSKTLFSSCNHCKILLKASLVCYANFIDSLILSVLFYSKLQTAGNPS